MAQLLQKNKKILKFWNENKEKKIKLE